MIKRILVLLQLMGAMVHLSGQLWLPLNQGCSGWVSEVYEDKVTNRLILAGSFNYASDTLVSGIATWDGNGYGKLGTGTGESSGQNTFNGIRSVRRHQNEIFVGGSMLRMQADTSIAFLARWDGTEWLACGKPDNALLVETTNSKLFAMGFFNEICGKSISKIAVWNGECWDRFGDSLSFDIGCAAYCSEYYLGEYYFAGNIDVSGAHKPIIRWNGADWIYFDESSYNVRWINDITVYKGILFVGGEFYAASGNAASYLMAWDGSNWFNPFPDVRFSTQVQQLEVIDGVLHIIGRHEVWNGTSWQASSYLSRFDGSSFCSYGGQAIIPSTIQGYGHEIYVGCQRVVDLDTLNYFAKWAGGDSVDVCITQLVNQEEPEGVVRMSLFPNPTASNFTLVLPPNVPNVQVRVLDLAGREVVAAGAYGVGSPPVGVEWLPAGVYFVEVVLRGQVEVIKLVKE
jgi:hypothetical protein